jgi:hypothetical protein
MGMLIDELDEIRQRTARRDQECADRFAAEARCRERPRPEAAEPPCIEGEPSHPERTCADAPGRQRAGALTPRSVGSDRPGPVASSNPAAPATTPTTEAELRRAVIRAAAARKANSVVAPTDDENEEDAYYRRRSWLD